MGISAQNKARIGLTGGVTAALMGALLAGCAVTATPVAAETPLPIPGMAPAASTPVQGVIPTIGPTSTPTPRPTPTSTPLPAVWTRLAPGIEQRYLQAAIPEQEAYSTVYALRLDPAVIQFEVYYDPAQPRSMEEWQAFTGAPIIFNAGFFGQDNRPVGRLVVDGAEFGFPLIREYGPESLSISGIFAVTEEGEAAIYAVGRDSYSPRGMRFEQAIESYPMLLLPGQVPTFPEDTGKRARRTIIGIDEWGYVVVLLIDQPIYSLYETTHWLSGSDLRLDSALNLDGGRSSGLAVSLPGAPVLIPSYVPLPTVLMAYPRGSR